MGKFRCMTCGIEIDGTGEYPYHTGFNETVFLYCDADTTVLTFSAYDSKDKALTGEEIPWYSPQEWKPEKLRLVEGNLISCPCGGRFSFDSPLKCPKCDGIFSEPMSKTIYFIQLNRRLDGEKTKTWRD